MNPFVMFCAVLFGPGLAQVEHPGYAHSDSTTAKDSVVLSIEASRRDDMSWLKSSPTSYLAAIARVDFGDRQSLTLGQNESNDIAISDSVFRPDHMSITVVGDSFRVNCIDPEATFRTRTRQDLREAVLPPSYVYVGRFAIRLSHQRYPAIIVFDPESPGFEGYRGLTYYPIDLSYRYELEMIPTGDPDTVLILSTRGNLRTGLREGWFHFTVRGVPCTLSVTRLLEPGIGEDAYSIFFRDATSGNETYAVGRYLEVERTGKGRFILDFNNAYNPACAISPYYNCPLPPEENTLPVRITAGEKDSHYGDH